MMQREKPEQLVGVHAVGKDFFRIRVFWLFFYRRNQLFDAPDRNAGEPVGEAKELVVHRLGSLEALRKSLDVAVGPDGVDQHDEQDNNDEDLLDKRRDLTDQPEKVVGDPENAAEAKQASAEAGVEAGQAVDLETAGGIIPPSPVVKKLKELRGENLCDAEQDAAGNVKEDKMFDKSAEENIGNRKIHTVHTAGRAAENAAIDKLPFLYGVDRAFDDPANERIYYEKTDNLPDLHDGQIL